MTYSASTVGCDSAESDVRRRTCATASRCSGLLDLAIRAESTKPRGAAVCSDGVGCGVAAALPSPLQPLPLSCLEVVLLQPAAVFGMAPSPTSLSSRCVPCSAAGSSSSASGRAAAPASGPSQSAFSACARPDVVASVRDKYKDLGGWPAASQLPITYNECFNIGAFLLRAAPHAALRVPSLTASREGCCSSRRLYPPCTTTPPTTAAGFWGLEKLHPFDSKKFQRVLAILEDRGVLQKGQLVEAHEATHAILREVHTEAYLNKLDSSAFKVAMVRLPPDISGG